MVQLQSSHQQHHYYLGTCKKQIIRPTPHVLNQKLQGWSLGTLCFTSIPGDSMAASTVRTSETQDKGEGNTSSVIFWALCSQHFHGLSFYLLPLLGLPFSDVLPTVMPTHGQSGVLQVVHYFLSNRMQVRKQQNWTWNNRLVLNRKRSTSRLYIVILLI